MKYRQHLPQLEGSLFLTDGGIETVLIFHRGLDLPSFAAFDLLKDDEGSKDGYHPAKELSVAAARNYHAEQIATFRDTAADMVTGITMTYVEEAIGITRAAAETGLPVAISFTVETDGCLPSGQALGEAIQQVDDETSRGPAYYMINCAHPTHFEGALRLGRGWQDRIRGLRANASRKSHDELDEATELDEGDPSDLGTRYAELRMMLQALNVLGGCCGTDHRHVEAICRACGVGHP